MHRILAPDAADGATVALPTDEAHHLARVLRLGPGADVAVFNGRGEEWRARVASIGRDRATVELVARREAVAEPAVAVTLAVAMLKGDQMDAVVRDATMLGASAILPLVTAHVALPAAAVRARSLDRWRRVAVASARQCGRAVVPEILLPAPVQDVFAGRASGASEPRAASGSSSAPLLIVCVEPSRLPVGGPRADVAALGDEARQRAAVLCIGPEGGWSNEELEAARVRGATLLGLGPRTLRAETAPTVALSTLWTHWGW